MILERSLHLGHLPLVHGVPHLAVEQGGEERLERAQAVDLELLQRLLPDGDIAGLNPYGDEAGLLQQTPVLAVLWSNVVWVISALTYTYYWSIS